MARCYNPAMRSVMARLAAALVLTLTVLPGYGAEISRDGAARLGVDVVLVKGNREARGGIISQAEDGSLTVAVRRKWLGEHQPRWAGELQDSGEAVRRESLETLVARIRAWLAGRPEDQQLTAIVRRELDAFEQQLVEKQPQANEADGDESEFVLIEIPADQVRRVFAQPPERKQLALVAWQERLENVESTPVDRLRAALEERDIDWQNTAVDLSDRLPATANDDEREWGARVAIYEYAFRQKLEFQGTGDFIVRTGPGGANAAGPELLGGLLQNGLAGDLNDLLGDALGAEAAPRRTWLEIATEAADAEDARGFRVTRTSQDLAARTVTVEDRFVARMPDGTWETVWTTTDTLDASKQRKDLEERIRADEQVAGALKLAEELGIGAEVTTAVRFGAATMEAQQTTDDRFFAFRDRYTRRLDGPVLKWAD